MATQPMTLASGVGRWAWSVATSQIGAKVLMALTGLALAGFLLGHMAGNLQFYLGADAINSYAAFLKAKPAVLWSFRLGLLACAVIHIVTGIWLKLQNMAARPIKYACEQTVQATYTSRSMVLTGLMVLAFIGYHLLHLTLGVTNPTDFHVTDATGRHDVFAMAVRGFANPWIAGAYIVAMLLLGLHLSHAISSVFQTLGLNNAQWNRLVAWIGPVFAVIVAAGFLSIPVGVLAGWIALSAGGN